MANQVKQLLMSRRSKKKSTYPSFVKVRQVLDELAIDDHNLSYLHVAGTNGKGSTTNFLRSILEAAGYRVGTFTSPFLVEYNDRIRINNQNISDHDLFQIVEQQQAVWDAHDLGMFEVATVIAITYFAQNAPDFIILETGIGGRLDGTNFVQPITSIITNVSFDHMAILGETIPAIAGEKAGIIKEQTPVVIGIMHHEALRVMEQAAEEKNAPLFITKQPTAIAYQQKGIDFNYQGTVYHLTGQAEYQMNNAALAIETSHVLRKLGEVQLTEKMIQSGISKAMWAGRFEEVIEDVYLDGAHNEGGVKALVQTLKRMNQKVTLIVAILKDKSAHEMLEEFSTLPQVEIILTSFDFSKPFHEGDLAKNEHLSYHPDYQALIHQAIEEKKAGELVVITGSLYFISEARKYILDQY